MTNMPTDNITVDQAVDIGESSMHKHVVFVGGSYVNEDVMRGYVCGCLAVLAHWLIKHSPPRKAFEVLTELADLAIKEGNDNASR